MISECLKYLCRNGYKKYTRDACSYAANSGQLECLKYLLGTGYDEWGRGGERRWGGGRGEEMLN